MFHQHWSVIFGSVLIEANVVLGLVDHPLTDSGEGLPNAGFQLPCCIGLAPSVCSFEVVGSSWQSHRFRPCKGQKVVLCCELVKSCQKVYEKALTEVPGALSTIAIVGAKDVVLEVWAHRVLLVEELQVVVEEDVAGATVKLHNVIVHNLTRLLLKQLNDFIALELWARHWTTFADRAF